MLSVLMDLSKIKILIDFVGRTNVTELNVSEKDVSVRIFQTTEKARAEIDVPNTGVANDAFNVPTTALTVAIKAPVFGVLHRASAPGQAPFVRTGDFVEQGQTLFIIEAMKVFNKIAAPRGGRIAYLTDIDGCEIETGDLLAEIAL